MTSPAFEDLMRRVRDGDQEAAAELVRRYEPAIRRVVRYRMAAPHLAPVLDSVDVCQGVLASFFIRAAAGQFEVRGPADLQALLLRMARNKVAFEVRRQRAQRRDARRVAREGLDETVLYAPGPTPSRQLAARELLQEAQRRLAADEWQLVELRQQGLGWDDIAARLQGGAEALRKKLARALDRVARELGLDGGEDGWPS